MAKIGGNSGLYLSFLSQNDVKGLTGFGPDGYSIDTKMKVNGYFPQRIGGGTCKFWTLDYLEMRVCAGVKSCKTWNWTVGVEVKRRGVR